MNSRFVLLKQQQLAELHLTLMPYDLCCIGHITLDTVITPQSTINMAGGTAFYFSSALARLPLNYLLVTAVADTEILSVKALQEKGVNVHRLSSLHTVHFENIYGHNQDERRQRVLQQAAPFGKEDLVDVDAAIFHLGPLLADDFRPGAIEALAAKRRLSLDAQGLLRTVKNQQVLAIDWQGKKELLPLIHYLKVNDEEMQTLTGETAIESGAKKLADWGVAEVIITLGSKGSVVYSNNQFYRIPAYKPPVIVDATGCGDTYMAGYLYKRIKGAGIQQAGEFAAAMAGLKISASGPFIGTEEEVNHFRAAQ